MLVHDLDIVIKELPDMPAVRSYEGKPKDRVFVNLGPLNSSTLYVGRWKGQSPWERHPAGEELVHVLAGEVTFTLIQEDKQVEIVLGAHSLFVVPRDVWHRQTSALGVTALYATPTPSDFSWTAEPPL
jgi:quercetin dioxygenase-like cupin family protein